MQQNKVVIQLKNGTVRKGITSDFLPNKARFHFTCTDGSTEAVDVDTLKALFFVKDIEGNKDYKETYNDVIQGEAGRSGWSLPTVRLSWGSFWVTRPTARVLSCHPPIATETTTAFSWLNQPPEMLNLSDRLLKIIHPLLYAHPSSLHRIFV